MDAMTHPLPPLKDLVDRWAIHAAQIQASFPGRPMIEGRRLSSDDGGGSWSTLDVVDADHAVLRAWDRDDFRASEVPIGPELAQQYPAWSHPYLPNDGDRVPTHLLAVWEDGTWRSAGHEGMSEDSLDHVLPMRSVSAMATSLADLVESYEGDSDEDIDDEALPPEEDEVAAACALGAGIDAGTLATLLRHPGLDAEAGAAEARKFTDVLG
ncbi:hypothetical protein ACSBQY_09490 [Micrococcus lylae]|uniref:hypothetical protein n=1 Tax=Micrococcus lylae TaxID=1273 RepID=UPI003EC09DE1